jgi:adenosylcobyric acid synthase
MLGLVVQDPSGIEGGGHMRGLELLPINTTLTREKITRQAEAQLLIPEMFGQQMICNTATGYEIHVGVTEYQSEAKPLFNIRRAGEQHAVIDGASSSDGRVIGTYLHGMFDDDSFRHAFLRAARAASQLATPHAYANVKAERETRFDRLAAHVRQAIDLDAILGWLNLTTGPEMVQPLSARR